MTNNTLGSAPTSPATQWQADLDHAIRAGDDHGVWEVMAQHHDQEEAHQKLAMQVARLAYQVSDRVRFSEMFLVPVIAPGEPNLFEDVALWRQASFCIGEALDGWLPARTRKTVFGGIRPYDWIGTWRPSVLRRHLNSTMPGANVKQVQFLSETIQCPDEAPKLGFISMVLTSERGWPQLPQANTLRDNRFKSVVGYALQATEKDETPTVLTPDHMQFAVTEGLSLWLRMLHETCPITGWSVLPVAASPDVVKITLVLDHPEVPLCQFTMRKHQIGLIGVNDVLLTLREMATMKDSPMDMPGTEQKARALDLT